MVLVFVLFHRLPEYTYFYNLTTLFSVLVAFWFVDSCEMMLYRTPTKESVTNQEPQLLCSEIHWCVCAEAVPKRCSWRWLREAEMLRQAALEQGTPLPDDFGSWTTQWPCWAFLWWHGSQEYSYPPSFPLSFSWGQMQGHLMVLRALPSFLLIFSHIGILSN